jgi:hypothetical protein
MLAYLAVRMQGEEVQVPLASAPALQHLARHGHHGAVSKRGERKKKEEEEAVKTRPNGAALSLSNMLA